MERIIKSAEYSYTKRQRLTEELCERYKFIKKSVIGKSCMGKSVNAFKIGSSSQYALIAAAFHGSERITSNIILMFLEELAFALENGGNIAGINAKRAFNGRGLIIVPCVNPDGCDISLLGEAGCADRAESIRRMCGGDFSHWNANARGVDINHNFNAGWEALRELERNSGIYGPAPTRFGGYNPESEPETVALTELCSKTYIRHVTALHSQGEVIYWSYGKNQPSRSRKMAEIMATSSGYALDMPVGIASAGGFKDWFIEKYNRPGFTVEVGKGENPLPADKAEGIYARIREMLMLCSIM